MFLHQVKMNCKKYWTPVQWVTLIALIGIYCQVGLGWPPLNAWGIAELGSAAIVLRMIWAFLKTVWEWGTAYCKKLRTFPTALRKFSRSYWSDQVTAA